MLALAPGDEFTRLLRASEVNLARILGCFFDQPGASFIEDARGVRFFNRNPPPPSMEMMTRWPESGAPGFLDAELQRFEEFGVPVDWYLFPPCSPPDMPRRLEERGLEEGSTRWLLMELGRLPEPPPMPSELRVKRVETPPAMDDWRIASAAGFCVSEAAGQRYHDAYVSRPRDDATEIHVHFVGYVDDAPVTSSKLLLAGGIAGVWDVSTAPEHRRRGYGACVTRACLDEARRWGYRYASLNSSDLGYSMYRSLGFDVECEIPEFTWRPAPRWDSG